MAGLLLLAVTVFSDRLQAQDQSADLAERLRTIEASQAQLLAQIKILQAQVGELSTRILALATPPSRPDAAPLPTAPVRLTGIPVKGSSTATIGIVEFSDFQCPYCGRFFKDAYQQLLTEYVQTGKVAIYFRHLPLTSIHPLALKSSQAAACAGEQSQFWAMHDALFGDQARLDDAALRQRAQSLRLDMAKYDSCVTSKAPAIVQADLEIAKSLQVSATPAFLVGKIQPDGTLKPVQRIAGAQPFSVFKAALDKLIQ